MSDGRVWYVFVRVVPAAPNRVVVSIRFCVHATLSVVCPVVSFMKAPLRILTFSLVLVFVPPLPPPCPRSPLCVIETRQTRLEIEVKSYEL